MGNLNFDKCKVISSANGEIPPVNTKWKTVSLKCDAYDSPITYTMVNRRGDKVYEKQTKWKNFSSENPEQKYLAQEAEKAFEIFGKKY